MGGQLEIVVKATNTCNACCVYCAAQSDPREARALPLAVADVFLAQAAQLVDSGRFARVRILWHGGEPLMLGKPFFRAIGRIARPDRLVHRMQTNLTLLDREWLEILDSFIRPDGLGTSVDPFDPLRQLPGQRDYTTQWLRRLGLLDATKWRVGCVYVAHRNSPKRTRQLYWFFRNLRDDARLSLRINPLLPVGRAETNRCEHLVLRPGEYGRFLIELTRLWLQDHRRLVVSPIREIVDVWQGRGDVRSCDLAGRAACVDSHLGIDADGNIYNCGRAVDANGMCFGNLRQVSLAECLEHPWRRGLQNRESTLLNRECRDCRYWRFCHGGCPYESHLASERDWRPTRICEDWQEFYRWLEREMGPPLSSASPGTRIPHRPRIARRTPAGRDAILWRTPAEWAHAIDRGRIQIRVRCSEDIGMAIQLQNAGRPVTLELPTSMYKDYLRLTETRRLPIDHAVADQPADLIDARLLAHVEASQTSIWVGPDIPGDSVQAVETLAAGGVPVTIDRLRDWQPDALRRLAGFFLHAPNLEVPIEPFYSVLGHLSPTGETRSLRAIYQEHPDYHRYVTESGDIAMSQYHASRGRIVGVLSDGPQDATASQYAWLGLLAPSAPCSTCEIFKHCRGFWVDPLPNAKGCADWRSVCSLLADAFRPSTSGASEPGHAR